MLARIRTFFAARDVLEVETPIASHAASTDPHLHSLHLAEQDLYLHTSPEFAMKRLLAADAGSIYQVARVFRAGESGRMHNPEFTLLEWYRVGYDYHALMQEVEALIAAVLPPPSDLNASQWLSYAEAFECHAEVDSDSASIARLQACAGAHKLAVAGDTTDWSRQAWLDLLMSEVVQPQLGRGGLSFVYDYPAEQASLARIRPGDPPRAERFEVFLEGVELGNGFQELRDAQEQRQRFTRELTARTACKLPAVPVDEHLLQALAAGLPECAGVALGFDRLVMIAAGAASIDQVLAFPLARA